MSRDLILVALALMTWGVGEGMFLFFEPLYLQEMGEQAHLQSARSWAGLE
jgi:hypothetical protein